MNALRVPIVGAVLAAAALAAFVPNGTQAQQSVSVTLSAEGNSGVTGRATLTPEGSGTKVVLELQNAPGPHPAHIHTGACGPSLNPAPAFPLTAVSAGRSETTVSATLPQILAAPHAINVHKSPQEASVYVSCGNITAAAAAAPAAQPSPKPAVTPAPAAPAAKPAAPAQAPKPAASPPAAPAAKPAAPAQAPKPAASPPAGLPRTGEAAGSSSNVLLAAVAGLALVGVGAFAIRRRRSANSTR